MLTVERLKQLLSYDPETGVFHWIERRGGKAKKGDVAGGIGNRGYIMIYVDSHKYSAHRLAWLYMTGKFPESHIDHIDSQRDNNIFSNLRTATNSENMQNRKSCQSNNKLGLLGVSPKREKFRAEICVEGKRYSLGSFDSPVAAHEAYLEAKRNLHPFNEM